MNDPSNPQDHTQLTCTTCNYDLQGLNLSGSCPECGDPIITDCFWCEYDLTNTAPDSRCPECGVPATTSIGRGPLATIPLDLLQNIHKGFRLVTLLILLYIVWAVVAAVGLVGFGLSSMSPDTMSLLVIPISIISNGIIFGIIFGWWKLASPIPGLPIDVDGSDRRSFLNATLLAFAIATAISMFVSFIPTNLDPDAPFTAVDYIMTGVQLIAFITMVVMYFAQMRYLQWFAKIAKNNKMHKRAKHLVWSGPLIFILGFMLLFLGPLIVLVLYWNTIEYLRRDVKKIIKSKTAFA